MPPKIPFPMKKHQETAVEDSASEEPKKPPSNLLTILGIVLCIGTFSFTFTVIGLYMSCLLPNQRGKLCYFEQYRTIL
jgi:hypothetical protein